MNSQDCYQLCFFMILYYPLWFSTSALCFIICATIYGSLSSCRKKKGGGGKL